MKKHKWFKGVDWKLVSDRGIRPPWIPTVRSPEDTQHFEEYPDSPAPPSYPQREEQDLFLDF